MSFKKIKLGVVLAGLVLGLGIGSVFVSTEHASAQTVGTSVCGNISSDEVWDVDSSPYIVDCTITVAEGSTLTIMPGAVLQFRPNTRLYISGNLIAEGTEDLPITFTNADSTLWHGIHIYSTASAQLDRVIIENTYNSYPINIYSNDVTLKNSIIREGTSPVIVNTSSPTIENTDIYVGLNYDGVWSLDLRDNYWGDQTGPYHSTLNIDGKGSTVSGNVIIDPWSYYPNNVPGDYPPIPPKEITLIKIDDQALGIIWRDNANDEDGFIIERKIGDEGAYAQLAELSAIPEVGLNGYYEDNNLDPNSKYCYRMNVYNANGASPYSSEKCITLVSVNEDDIPITVSQNISNYSAQNLYNEDMNIFTATSNDLVVSGVLTGTIELSEINIAEITTGPFAGKGVITATANTTIEGLFYRSILQLVVIKDSENNSFVLKGSLTGNIEATIEGVLESNVLIENSVNPFHLSGKLVMINEESLSGNINIAGEMVIAEKTTYSASEMIAYQISLDGETGGFSSNYTNIVLTHIGINDENNPMNGSGFSLITYNTDVASGNGWSFDKQISEGVWQITGVFSEPMDGLLEGVLDLRISPESFLFSIKRTDFGLPPSADVKVKTWGPINVSPGQTVDYVVEVRNDGLIEAKSVDIISLIPWQINYQSNTGGGIYEKFSGQINWNVDLLPMKVQAFSVRGVVIWELPQGMQIKSFIQHYEEKPIIIKDPLTQTRTDIISSSEENIKLEIIFENEAALLPIDIDVTAGNSVGLISSPTFLSTKSDSIVSSSLSFVSKEGIPILISIKYPDDKFIVSGGNILSAAELIMTAGESTVDMAYAEINYAQRNAALNRAEISQDTRDILQPNSDAQYVLETIGLFLTKITPHVGTSADDSYTSAMGSMFSRLNCTVIMEREPDLYNQMGCGNSHTSIVRVASDPNIKYGPEGSILPGQVMDYRVEYENEGEGIAFGVYVTDQLDEKLDDYNLQIGPMLSTIDGSEVGPPGIYNPNTRTITWFVGEVGPGEGGFSDISLNARNDLAEGESIINYATVYFPSVPEETRTNAIVSTYLSQIPPTANAGESYESTEGTEITFDASGSTDADGSIVLYEWDFDGDGNYDESSISSMMTYTYGDDYNGEVILKVTDDEGLTGVASAFVNITNANPEVQLYDDQMIEVFDKFMFENGFTDAGWLDSHTAEIDWGDGTVENISLTEENEAPEASDEVVGSHIYNIPDTYAATLTVTDDDGGVGTDEFLVTVEKRKTELVYTGDINGQYSDKATLQATLTDKLGGVEGKTINLSLGSQFVSAVTNSEGIAEVEIALNEIPEIYEIETSFQEDEFYLSSSNPTDFEITKDNTLLSIPNGEIIYSDDTTIQVTLYDNENEFLLKQADSQKTVYLEYFNGTEWRHITKDALDSTDDTDDTDDTLDLYFQIPDNLDEIAGSYDLRARFLGDDYYNETTSEIGNLEIIKEDTILSDPSAIVTYSDSSTLEITFQDNDGETLLHQSDELKTVYLEVLDGTEWKILSEDVLNSNDNSDETLTFTFEIQEGNAVDLSAGNYDLRVRFDGDSRYNSTAIDGTLTIIKESVAITVEDQEGFFDDTVVLEATVLDDDGENLYHDPYQVSLMVGDHQVGEATIDENGKAEISWLVEQIPTNLSETYPITVSFVENEYYLSGEGQGEFNVKSAKQLKEDTLAKLRTITTDNKQAQKEIDKAIEDIENSLNPELWVGASRLDERQGHKVFDREKQAIKSLLKIIEEKGKHDNPEIVTELQDVINNLAKVDILLAKVAIYDAESIEADDTDLQKKIDDEINKAKEELEKAFLELADDNPDKAIDHLKKSWKSAQLAIDFLLDKTNRWRNEFENSV